MNGGLQKGHKGVSDRAAKTIDSNLKSIRDELFRELKSIKGLDMKKRVPKIDTKTPCEPDGGAWFYNGKLVAAFEAKKQQDSGNAIERWYKNERRCRKLNPDMSYVTFCRGTGAHPDGSIGIVLDVAHENGWNEYVPGDNSCWLSIEGYTKSFLKDTMREVILERVESACKSSYSVV